METGGTLLNHTGNTLVNPKPLICIERRDMNGFKKLFFHLLLHSKGAWSTEAAKVAALLFLRGKRKINTRVIG